jgi:anti-anti-sigma factor
MDSDLEIVVSQEQEQGLVPVTVYHLKGVIGAHTYERLETQAAEDFANGMRNLLLDLSEVTYMSSAGLRALHEIFAMLQADTTEESNQAMRKGMMAGTFKSPNLKLLKPAPDVLRVIQIQGFDMFLEILSDYQKAIASF